MDITYLLWLQSIREGLPAPVQACFAFLGSDVASLLVLLVPCLVYWCLDKRSGTLALLAYGFSWFCNQLIKNTVCCYRPWVRDARVKPEPSAIAGASGYSFPSGHTQSAASMLGGLGWSARERRWPLVLALAFAALVGFSRNILGVHAPQDVLVGFVEGCVFVLAADRLLSWAEAAQGRDARVVAASLLAIVLCTVFVTVKPYPVDYVDGELLVDPIEMLADCYKASGGFAGLLIGWYLERHVVRFETGGLSRREVAARLTVGAAIVLVAYKPLGHLLVALMGPLWGELVRHFVAFVLAVAVVPMLFPRLSSWLSTLDDRNSRA